MGLVLDIIIICVIALFILVGVRRGFIRAAVRFAGVLAAAVFASILGDILATLIYDNFFREEFTRKISESISGVTGSVGASAGVSRVLDGLPDFLQRALEGAGITVDKLAAMLSTGTGDAARIISDAISPVFINMLKVLCVIVLFMILMIVVRGLKNIVAGMFNLPLLGWLNSLLGGVFGLLMSLLFIWIVLAIINVFTPMLSLEAQLTIEDTVGMSVLADRFISFNPFDGMFK